MFDVVLPLVVIAVMVVAAVVVEVAATASKQLRRESKYCGSARPSNVAVVVRRSRFHHIFVSQFQLFLDYFIVMLGIMTILSLILELLCVSLQGTVVRTRIIYDVHCQRMYACVFVFVILV